MLKGISQEDDNLLTIFSVFYFPFGKLPDSNPSFYSDVFYNGHGQMKFRVSLFEPVIVPTEEHLLYEDND